MNRVIGSSGGPRLAGTGRLIGKMRAFACRALVVARAALREIFDESAYDRFLARTHSERSVSSYRAFMREREHAMAYKQRCC
jgi:hypothetical protein